MKKTKHYKEIAEEMGRTYSKAMEAMSFFRFDSSKNSFVPIRGLEGASTKEFVMNRKRMEQERGIIKSVMPYVAYITAPTQIEADDVIGSGWEETRIMIDNLRKFNGVNTDGYGFDTSVSDADAIQNYMMFSEGFKITAGYIEKILPKIENTVEDVLITQEILDGDTSVRH